MEKPVLYYMLLSPPVRSVLLTAKEINLDLELRYLDMLKNEHLKSEYLKINPQHTIPTLIDVDGTVIWDSHVIATYLISKYAQNDSLYPKDLAIRCKIDQRLHFDSGVLFVAMGSIARNVMLQNQFEISSEIVSLARRGYTFLEAFLDDHYLVGNSLTVADLCCIPTITSLNEFIPIDSQAFPRLVDYVKRISQELPYYEEINVNGNNQLKQVITKKMEENFLKADKKVTDI